MTTKSIIICDNCGNIIDIGNKYYQVMERIKGEYANGCQTYCSECFNIRGKQ